MISKKKAISKLVLSAMLMASIPIGPIGVPAALAEPAVRTDYNLLTNSGFETDLKGWNAGSTAALVRDTTEFHSGAASAKVDRSTSYSGNIRQLGVSFEPGQAYYFSAWVKRVSGSGAVAIYITQTGNKWNNSTYPIMAEAVVGTSWTHIEGIKTFPTEPSPPPSGYVYDNADVYIQHKVDDKETKDPAGHYVDFYVDDIIAEPVLPSTIAISGSASAAIPLAGSQTYFYTKTVKNQMGNTTGITDSAITWSVDGDPAGVSIDGTTGALTVTDTAEAGIIAVRAVSEVNPSAAATYPVELTPTTPDPEPKAPAVANVRVDGNAKPGRVLTGIYDYTDANGDKEAGSSYNWLIGDTPAGPFAAIPEVLGRTYTVSEDDLNKYVQFQVTPKNGADPAVGDSKSSQPVLVMANAAPTAENVRISGVQFVGRQLSAAYTYKDADGDPEAGSVYRWLQSDSPDGTYSPIDGAGQAVLELSADLEGTYIQFEVTPSDAYSKGGAYLSQPTEKIAAVASPVYYVDPVNGDDTNSGTNENAAFKTILKARDIVRMSSSDMTHDITVILKGGRYEQGYTLIDEPLYDQFGKIYATRQIKSGTLSFDERDSGTNGFNVIYQAAPGETPVISGGRSIAGWTLHDAEKNIYRASNGGNLDTRQLYVNGVRAVRARSEGGLTNAVQTATGYTTSDTFLADWGNISNLEMVFKVEWTNPRAKVQSISVADGVAHITMQQPGYNFAANKGGTSIKTPWYYENAYELLDQPGEWYMDSSEGYFYYKPRPGENMATAEAVAPELEQLLTIQGSTLDTPVHHMKFSGITFEYNTWLRPSTSSGLSDAQNNHIRETGSGFGDRLGLAAVTLQNAKSVVFEGNTFSHLGSIALKTLEGSQDNLIIGNTFTDISGNAIAIGEPNSDQQHTADIRKLNRNNNVLNNYIRDIGVEYRSSAAISAGYPIDMEISHNEIGHVPYSGLHVGYGWATSPDSNLRNVSIQNNLIYDSMEQLHDGGAIYTLGTTGGSLEEASRVSGNYLLRMHNEFGALYFDEGSNYWNATDNVVETAPTYLHIWKDTIEDVHVNNTYTSTNLFRNDGTHTRVSNTQWFQDAVWPSEALDIIEQAGLEAPYRHLRPSEPVERLFIKDLPLQSGQSAEVEVAAALTHNGASVDLSLSDILFTSDNPEVVTIDGSGTVTAVGPGKASLRATVNGQPVIVANAIYVDDQYDKLTVSASKPILMPGQSIHLDVLGISKYGKLYSKGPLTFVSTNPQAATVSDTGKVTAIGIGSTEIVVTGQSNGMLMSGSVTITVANAQADDIIKDIEYWYLSGTSKAIPGDGSLTVSTPSGDAIFQGKRYEDELLKVNMQIDDPTGGWHAITFRNLKEDQSYSSSINEDYMITMTPEAVELHRFNKSVRTVVYGTFNGTNGIMGPPIPNEYFSFGERHTVELGALNVADGVRIILNVDGHSVIDTVDSLNGHLTTPGFMGLYSRTGTITLSYPESDEPDDPDDPTVQAPAAPALQLGATESNRASLSWTAIDGAINYAIFKSTASGSYGSALDTVTGSTYSYTAQGLTNGTPYYFVVKAIGPGGESPASNEIAVVTASPPAPDSSAPSGPAPVNNSAQVLVNGKPQDAGTLTNGKRNDRTVTTVTLDPKKLEERLAAEGQQARVTIPFTAEADIVAGELTGQMVKSMEQRQAVLEMKTGSATYTLPAGQMNISALSAQLGADMALEDILVRIEIAKPAANTLSAARQAAKQNNLTLVTDPLEFTISAAYNGKTIGVSKFNGFVERTIALPHGADPQKITTGVVIGPEGNAVRHVPTKITKAADGSYVAQINSLTNSMYAVVWHPAAFKDVASHWAKNAVNDIGSRLVIGGVGQELFNPDQSITRAEFAAIIVRGLGLAPENSASPFSDVQTADWYSSAVQTAYAYKLIGGFEDGTFQPMDNITREQAMAIIAKAMGLAGIPSGQPAPSLLNGYDDADRAASWAVPGILQCLQTGIISGRSSTELAPKAFISRAETAVLVQRLLLKAGLI